MRRPVLFSAVVLVLAGAGASSAWASAFTAGDLVISLYGNGDGSGNYTDNAASPIVLQEITRAGATVGAGLVLPQTTTTVNGTTQYAISGEYGSSSEGLLQLSGNGKSLAIAGYGVSAAAYNGPNGAATYGGTKNGAPALAQTTSVQGGSYTAVPRVIATIDANKNVDTSTALYNVFDQNNPRSVATVDGSTFYIAGQGTGATNQGVFAATKGASTATAIASTTDYRDVQIVNGQLYASRDNKSASVAEVDKIGTGTPTTTATATALPGIGPTITLTAALANGVNNARIGSTVYLSPESYFYANATTLYIADSGNPKNGNTGKAQLGEGGLQKWVLTNGTWVMEYDIYAGLGLVSNATATAGTSGLIGLTGEVDGDNVYLYATNATLGDMDPTFVFSVVDSLSNLNATIGSAETFNTIYTAATDVNVRGIAFAPESDDVPEPASIGLLLAATLGTLAAVRRRA